MEGEVPGRTGLERGYQGEGTVWGRARGCVEIFSMVRGVGGVWLGLALAWTEQGNPEDCFATRILIGMVHGRVPRSHLQVMRRRRRHFPPCIICAVRCVVELLGVGITA